MAAALDCRQIEGDLPDLLGNTRLTGKLAATADPGLAAHLIREAELLAAQ